MSCAGVAVGYQATTSRLDSRLCSTGRVEGYQLLTSCFSMPRSGRACFLRGGVFCLVRDVTLSSSYVQQEEKLMR